MPIVVRPRGQRYELRVRHRLLPRPFYATFLTDAEAQAYGQQLDAMLDRGVVPHELLAQASRTSCCSFLGAAGASHITGAASCELAAGA